MAGANRRVNSRTERNRSEAYAANVYVDGNTVKRVQAVPGQEERTRPKKRPKVSPNAHRNRKKALQMSKGYVFFIGAVCVATLFSCVQFLQLKADFTSKTKEVAVMEAQLSKLKADNDAFYSETLASVDLIHVRNVALHNLDMDYAREDQIIYYSTNGSNYVRQYQDVPDME